MDAITDGSYTLADTLSAIRFKEAGGWALIAMASGPETASMGGASVPINYMSFEPFEDDVKAVPNTLVLETIGTGSAVARTISQKDAAGWDLVVYCKIYVQSQLEQVAAFRKR